MAARRLIMRNSQRVEKLDIQEDGSLDVHSVFYTIQGEGPFTGCPAVFIRLAGCNLQCPGCDTDYTSKRRRRGVESLLDEVEVLTKGTQCSLVVITGGEPFRQRLDALCRALTLRKWVVQIETNGTLPVSEQIGLDPGVFIVCSPKTGNIQQSISLYARAYKYVVDAESGVDTDGIPNEALGNRAVPKLAKPRGSTVYLQPRDEQDAVKNEANLAAVVSACMEYGHTFQLQIHKLIGVE